ncbi:MAG: flagellin [Peptostreptococcaceae bacterium]
MRVNTNVNAMVATNQMAKNTALQGNSMEKLSTGMRINKAGDDAAGLAISEKMRSQIRGMEQAERNVQDGVSLIQTAEGAMEEAGNIAQRMRELTVQGANDTNTDADRSKIETELSELGKELTKLSEETKFNEKNLLDGSNQELTIQAGANDETRTIDLMDMKGATDLLQDLKVGDNATAQASQDTLDTFIEDLNTARSTLGAQQNRLEYTASNLTNTNENLTSAESRIRDVDVAKEMVQLSKLNIIGQAAQSMAAQAKQQPQGVMQLLQ